jgi:hypothetical protein
VRDNGERVVYKYKGRELLMYRGRELLVDSHVPLRIRGLACSLQSAVRAYILPWTDVLLLLAATLIFNSFAGRAVTKGAQGGRRGDGAKKERREVPEASYEGREK